MTSYQSNRRKVTTRSKLRPRLSVNTRNTRIQGLPVIQRKPRNTRTAMIPMTPRYAGI